jgi:hypothetical protein
MNWDGRRIVQWLGSPDWAFSDFRVVLDGVIADVYDPGNNQIGFHIADKSALLNRPVMLTTIGGSGPSANEPMPLVYGALAFNIAPPILSDSNHTYQLSAVTASGLNEHLGYGNDGLSSIEVREKGARLTGAALQVVAVDMATGTLTASAPHGMSENTRVRWTPAATLPGGFALATSYWVSSSGLGTLEYRLSATRGGSVVLPSDTTTGGYFIPYNWDLDVSTGVLQLPSSPTGQITVDTPGLAQGGSITGDYLTGATLPMKGGEIIQALLTSALTNTPFTSGDLDSSNFSSFNSTVTQELALYVAGKTTFQEVLDRIMLTLGGWWGCSRAGLLQLGRLTLPSAGTPDYSFVAGDMQARSFSLRRRILPKAQVKMGGVHNWTVQTDLAGNVVESLRAELGKPYIEKIGTATVTTWDTDPTNHKSVEYPDTVDSLFTSTSDTETEAGRRAAMFQTPTGIYGFKTHQAVFLLNIGSLIYVTHSRFTGYGIVTAIAENAREITDIEFFAQIPDVYPSADIE